MAFTRRAVAQVSAARHAARETRGANPSQPWGDSVPPTNSEIAVTSSGIPVTQNTAAGIAAVYGCCSLIADSVGGLPVELRNGPIRRTSKQLPESALLKQPYAEISRRDWWVQFMWSLALRGNFYGQRIEYNPDGSTRQIKPIHNDNVRVERNQFTGEITYRFYGKVVPNKDVFHVRYQSTAGMVVGLSPIQLCAMTFGNSIAQSRFVESFYLNSANPMGVIEVPGYLDRTETRKMYRGWLAAHQSINKANLPAILTEGAKFNPITINPGDAQLLEAMAYSDMAICGKIFRVPPHMIGLVDRTTSWGRGIEQMERGFFANTLIGYLTIGIEALTAEHPEGQFVHFNTTERTRGAILERAQAGALLMNSGIGIADDLREWFDWDVLPGGNGQESFVPINTQLLDAALLALKQAKTMGEAPVAGAVGGQPPQLPISTKPPRTKTGTGVAIKPADTNRSEAELYDDPSEMSPERALDVLEQVLTQARQRQTAMDMAMAMIASSNNNHNGHEPEE